MTAFKALVDNAVVFAKSISAFYVISKYGFFFSRVSVPEFMRPAMQHYFMGPFNLSY